MCFIINNITGTHGHKCVHMQWHGNITGFLNDDDGSRGWPAEGVGPLHSRNKNSVKYI